ncbi:MAG: DNA recombination protein RmuC [Bacteroidales bacterium]|nr:DNA recombination protein RmuC [Bacteroidales bacterium]
MNIVTLVFAIVGIVLGAVVTAVIFKGKNSAMKASLDATSRQLEETKVQAKADLSRAEESFNKRIAELKSEEQQRCKDAIALNESANKKAMDALTAHYEQSISDMKQQFASAIKNLSAENIAATEKILKDRQNEFAESSKKSLGGMVESMNKSMGDFRSLLQDYYKETVDIKTDMKSNIEMFIKQSKDARDATKDLTNAILHKSKVQGDLGEYVLLNTLETQNLVRGVHFDIQSTLRDSSGETIKDDKGSKKRPDVILHLDATREIIIDSKVSLTSFKDYANADNDKDGKVYLAAHIKSIRSHIDELKKADYASYIVPPKTTIDYVIMFVPYRALWTALNEEPSLWQYAMNNKVYLADEQTLFAMLNIIRMTWIQSKQAQNHEQVYKLANEMISRVNTFVGTYKEVGKALQNAQNAYDEGSKKLNDRGHSIVVTAKQLIEIGANKGKNNHLPKLPEYDEVEAEEVDVVEDESNVGNSETETM